MKRLNEWLAINITKVFGSMWMFYALVLWQLGWMTLATLGIWLFKFDQYPFTFLLFLGNLIQLWALPVLAVGQNLISGHHKKHHEDIAGLHQKLDKLMNR